MKNITPRLRTAMRAAAVVLGPILALTVFAQTVTQNIQLAWVAPTKNTDGSPITGTLTYTLFQGPVAGPFTQVASGLSAISTTVTSVSAGNCFALVAVETQGASSTASAPAPTVCALIPASPTGLSVSVTITVK